ncbi:MAG: FHA domain-containing protein [Myxococcales bacterium]|nr:FHA domain-containing protein [Myxococcales bacterium]MCB9670863.1 FHA domain-containing protein [Alphaproteobacteria bacterium]MCB9691096.1 FHA domain-containing protein [Alphaproteobacteria bacterium]
MRVELVLTSSGQAVPLTEAPLQLGRGPANHVVITDDTVSWNHAQVWVEGGRVWIRDLGSRNGTWVNEGAVRGAQPVEPGDVLRFGLHQKAGLRVPFGEDEPLAAVLKLEEMATGLQFMLQSNRFHIGSAPDAHLRIEGAPARAATLLIHEDEIWVGTADEEFQVAVDEPFVVAGRTMRIVEARVDHVPTVEHSLVKYPYTARLIANGPRGPEAFLSGPAGERHQCDGNRAILLLLLARALARDREARVDEDEEGWVSDEDVRTGVWGRGRGTKSGLNVLVHRTRKQLETDGFDPWFIEKKRRGIRARLQEIDLEE